MQIMIDKVKNRKKYHFLSQKALSDEQIYNQFKQQFDVNADARSLGNKYMKEFSDVKDVQFKHKKSNSVSLLPSIEKKKQYKNYLIEIKSKKLTNSVKLNNEDQFEK